jgi:hypothetical protein
MILQLEIKILNESFSRNMKFIKNILQKVNGFHLDHHEL